MTFVKKVAQFLVLEGLAPLFIIVRKEILSRNSGLYFLKKQEIRQ